MIDLAAYELNKYYGSNHVIKGITFEVYTGEKVGLLGRNGSGKTTLFKVLTGEEPYESGTVSKASGKRVGMMAQIPEFGENDTAEDILRASFQEIADIHAEMKQIEGDEDPSVLLRYGHLLEEYERLGGYETEVKLDKVTNGIGIDEKMRKSLFRELSGGEKSRINLARILLRDCDVLLLDEPTNHLDLASLEWLEAFLSEYKGTVVVISHDRLFLDRVVTRIIEITDGKADFYAGNYSYFIEEKEQRFLTQSEQYEQQQRKIRQLETAAKRMHEWAKQADSKALHKRAFAMEKRIEQMDKVDRPITARKLTAEFDSGRYAARELVTFENVGKRYGAKVLLRDLKLSVLRSERIALVGENGCGKTTLLKMLTGQEPCDSGEIRLGPSVKAAYMPQIITFEDDNATVLDTLRFFAGLSEERTRSILAGFHFKAADVMKKVGTLSGGEKSRLKLCMLMQNDVNFLLLDEPTNHLDIATREWIENALTDFEGTMLFVSHDRYFLNKFADQIWSMENGVITKYGCGFDEYLELTRPAEAAVSKPKTPALKVNLKEKIPIKSRPEKAIPTEELIREAEAELGQVNAAIDSDLQNAEFVNMKALVEQKSRLEEKIDSLYDKWSENA
ncbi:MAG TPA: ABC-F type ribosomal protection protein [Oscillospiraceae bacterium]|nr:ABC-F type ribosomal protection protein [Oscillospiraceae bacterium]HPS34833.1 ABC-F type ribosomal protection protein [Oscillospiraceae bacterium]